MEIVSIVMDILGCLVLLIIVGYVLFAVVAGVWMERKFHRASKRNEAFCREVRERTRTSRDKEKGSTINR